jgi:hypothetical protein
LGGRGPYEPGNHLHCSSHSTMSLSTSGAAGLGRGGGPTLSGRVSASKAAAWSQSDGRADRHLGFLLPGRGVPSLARLIKLGPSGHYPRALGGPPDFTILRHVMPFVPDHGHPDPRSPLGAKREKKKDGRQVRRASTGGRSGGRPE